MKETFGQRFARLRKANGFTQDDVANKVNVSSQAVSKWENDINMPDIGILLTLAEFFGVTTDELLGKEITIPTRYEANLRKKDINKLMLKIRVDSAEGDKVTINLPFQLAKIAIESSNGLTINGGKSDILSKIDFNQVVSMVEQGLLGEIITVDSADGDHVRILVE